MLHSIEFESPEDCPFDSVEVVMKEWPDATGISMKGTRRNKIFRAAITMCEGESVNDAVDRVYNTLLLEAIKMEKK